MRLIMCCLCLAMLALHVFAPEVMASAGTGSGLPYEGWLTSLRTSVTGPFAFAVALIGIVVAGSVLMFGGDLNGFFRTLFLLVLVISFVIGANSFMTTLFGQGAVIVVGPSPLQVWGA